MYIKYNLNNFNYDKIVLSVASKTYDEETSTLTITTVNNHYLNNDDRIMLHYDYKGMLFKKYYSVFNVEEKKFSISLPSVYDVFFKKSHGTKYKHFVRITNSSKYFLHLKPSNFINVYSNKEKKELINSGDKNGEIFFDLKNNKYYKIIDDECEEYKLFFNFIYRENNIDYKINLLSLGEDFYELTVVENTEEKKELEITFDESIFYSLSHNIKFNFNPKDPSYDDFIIKELYYFDNDINIPVNITSNFDRKLNNELIADLYFTEKKNEIIPDIVDYEKKCFSPYYKDGDTFKPVYGIKFNLFFRDRMNDYNDWDSNDTLYWNSWKPGITTMVNTDGDPLGKLGFTDDDVFYQKLKIKKSFLRLSFYNDNNPFKQMLLYYSTIFVDSNDLYGKYIKNIGNKVNENDIREIVNSGALTTSFVVYDKFEQTKSSEGFYLYLFPNQNPTEEKTIYMCVEFNHAGYGKTIPFITQYNTKDATAIDFGSDFKDYFIDEKRTTSLNEYFNRLHIPLTASYNEDIEDYIYYFNIKPSQNDYSSYRLNDDGILVINLYEPKLNKTPEQTTT